MTAFQTMILSALGLPEMPTGGSVANLLKSLTRRRLACVDWDVSWRLFRRQGERSV